MDPSAAGKDVCLQMTDCDGRQSSVRMPGRRPRVLQPESRGGHLSIISGLTKRQSLEAA